MRVYAHDRIRKERGSDFFLAKTRLSFSFAHVGLKRMSVSMGMTPRVRSFPMDCGCLSETVRGWGGGEEGGETKGLAHMHTCKADWRLARD